MIAWGPVLRDDSASKFLNLFELLFESRLARPGPRQRSSSPVWRERWSGRSFVLGEGEHHGNTNGFNLTAVWRT